MLTEVKRDFTYNSLKLNNNFRDVMPKNHSKLLDKKRHEMFDSSYKYII